jgi:hypothetical protein
MPGGKSSPDAWREIIARCLAGNHRQIDQ